MGATVQIKCIHCGTHGVYSIGAGFDGEQDTIHETLQPNKKGEIVCPKCGAPVETMLLHLWD